MKMPNDDFLNPLKKRPDTKPAKDFEDSLHNKLFKIQKRNMAAWKFRLILLAILITGIGLIFWQYG
ncbi:MAG: hypothetical protein LRY73_14290 [Bacillus sp. (in: Bacteria)]|nr:hypothetical protein [Bacillus sp. (in: firmicutes)]